DEHGVRILWIDQDASDLTCAVEPQMRPRLARVGGLVHPVAVGNLRAHVGFTAANIDDVGIRGRNAYGPNRSDWLRVKHRPPRASRVGILPRPAATGAEVEGVRLAVPPAHRVDPPAAKGSDHPPA